MHNRDELVAPDLILLLLRAPTKVRGARDRVDGVTRLEKLLYLVERETPVTEKVGDRFEFKPYHFGPYSRAVYEAVELLEEAGLLREDRVFAGGVLDEVEEEAMVVDDTEGVERRFLLTDDGIAVADLLANQYPQVIKHLTEIKDKYSGMSLSSLIRVVYTKYPESAVQSRIRDQI